MVYVVPSWCEKGTKVEIQMEERCCRIKEQLMVYLSRSLSKVQYYSTFLVYFISTMGSLYEFHYKMYDSKQGMYY